MGLIWTQSGVAQVSQMLLVRVTVGQSLCEPDMEEIVSVGKTVVISSTEDFVVWQFTLPLNSWSVTCNAVL